MKILWKMEHLLLHNIFKNPTFQNVGPDLDPNCLTLMVFQKEFFEKDDFEKKNSRQNALKITQHAKLNPPTAK